MESRFRVRFWPSRRVKIQPNSELDLHSVPYQTAPACDKQPVFIHQSLGRNLSERQKRESTSPLRALSYRHTKPGKAPIFGGRPQKGNGPVKLQTNRILSSGELLETSQDAERTMEDIREGEYIVPGKDRRDSRSQSVKSPVATHPSSQAPPSVFLSSIPQVPSLQPTWGNAASIPLLDIPENAIIYDASSPTTTQSEPAIPCFSRPHSRKQAAISPNASVEGLGISEAPPLPVGILKNSSKLSLLEPHEEQNPTIRALWKAEYGRLVAIYGQDGVDRNIVDLKRDSTIPSSDHRQSREDGMPTFNLEPLPRPSIEYRDGTHVARSSRTSRNEASHNDDTSDESSKRLSFISTAAYSSYTSGTSVAESDSIVSRADIRKVVDDMRSTYLQALETREPSLQAVKSMKKRTKKRKSSTPGGTPRSSSFVRSSLGPSTPEPSFERQSMTTDGTSPTVQSQRSTRVVSQPVAGINKLPAIAASPKRDEELEVGLVRADSGTLGALMGETKRASIKKRRSKRNSRRLSTQSKTSEVSPKKSTFINEEPALSTDIANMYSDIFRSSSDDFWASSPTIASTVHLPSSFETTSTVFGTSPTSSPIKKSALVV